MLEKQHCKEDYNEYHVPEKNLIGLDRLFELQKGLMEKIAEKNNSNLMDVANGNCTDKEQQWWVEHMISCMHNELEEIREWFPWKSWKQYKDFKTNKVEVKYEIIDMLHFLLELMLIMGMDSKEVFQIMYSKMKINHERQDNNY